MASHTSFRTSGLVLVIFTIIIIQSAPIEKDKETVQLPSIINNKGTEDQHILKFIDLVKTASISTSTPTTTTTSTTVSQSSLKATTATQQKTDNKKKRYINDGDDWDERLENEIDELDSSELPYLKYDNAGDNVENKLYAKTKETSPAINDSADKSINTDDSKLFSDIKMTPNQQTDIVRRRRDVKLNTRRKRAASPYDFYDTDSLEEPQVDLIQRYRYIRPTRSFDPLYWYPSFNQRNVREALLPSFYDSIEYPPSYSQRIGSNDIEENSIPIVEDQLDDEDEDEDEDDYESNRYPILLPSYDNPRDSEQLQEKYNRDDIPIDEDFEENLDENDDDEDEDSDDENDENDDYDDDGDSEFIYQKQRPSNNRYGFIETYF
ncbi:unnamed protein product [Rotaria magnacalcarata]|uniref:Uncharacterized protein n=3 Tax=Rotaria magnacalcarata TaxID=392030 RepID=A0A814S1Z4_9BILA|nr:unnamed protein product [Rotaria magnacalcarata]CAF1542219.1 unnamed protein product [Rotaria magnacalcarata]CAF3792630.1 unnamed protein product [Rotaria magnacalcarata]CAF3860763.1 unnamed protein product [Rotaria magnacalcarata]